MHVACVLDANSIEWPAVASGALVIFLGGVGLLWAKWRLRHYDKQEEKEKAALAAELAARVGLQIEAECEKLRYSLAEETRARTLADNHLGDDIVEICNEMSHDYGERNKPRPRFGKRSSGDD